jgi:hypothetical protein
MRLRDDQVMQGGESPFWALQILRVQCWGYDQLEGYFAA